MPLGNRLWVAGYILLALAGCSQDKTVSQIAQDTKESVVLITYGDKKGHGSGFFVPGPEGICQALTVAHVVEPSKEIKLTTHDKQLFTARYVQSFPNVDLAVVAFVPESGQTCPYKPLQLGDSDRSQIGDSIVMVGYPTREGAERLVIQSPNGTITAVEKPPLPEGYALSYDVTTVGGMSGAPVIDITGKVVAVHGLTDAEIVSMARNQQGSLSLKQAKQVDDIAERSSQINRINHFKWGVPIRTYLNDPASNITTKHFFSLIAKRDITIHQELLNKSLKLIKEEQYKEAKKTISRAIKISPENATTWSYRGLVLRKSNNYQESMQSYQKALEIDPYLPSALIGRVHSLINLGIYEDEVSGCEEVTKINPNFTFYWDEKYQKDYIFACKKYFKESINYLKKSIEINPKSTYKLRNIGRYLNGLERYKEAIYYLDKAIGIKSCSPSIWYHRGYALEKIGQSKAALESYKKALKCDEQGKDKPYFTEEEYRHCSWGGGR